jgi:GAF domain-containing protein
MVTASTGQGMPGATASRELPAWLDAIGEIAHAVNKSLPLEEVLDLIAATTCRLTGYDFCAVLLEDRVNECLLIKGAFGLSQDYVAEINARSPIGLRAGELGEGPSSRAFRSQRPVTLFDIHADRMCLPWEGVASEQGYRSLLAVPLVAGHEPLGLLNCYTAEPHAFGAHEIILMETVANQAALAIESTNLRARERSRIEELMRLNRELDEQRTTLQRAEQVHRELMRVLLDGALLPEVATALAGTLDCEIIVEDAGGAVLAASRGRSGRMAAPVYRDAGEVTPFLHQALDDRRTVEVPPPADQPGALPSLLTPIVLEGEVAGRVWACRPTTPFGAFDWRSFESGAVVVALAMLRSRTAQEVEWRLSRDVVDELLSAEDRPSEGLVDRARQLGTDLSVPHVVLVARPDPVPSDQRVRRLPDNGRMRRSLLSAVQRCAERNKVPVLVATRADHVVVLWPETGSQPTVRSFAEELDREIRAYATGWTASVAMGPRCDDVTGYANAYRLVCGALDLVQEAGRAHQIVSLDDLGVYRLLLQVNRPAELLSFARSVLGPLHEYDERRETFLAQTLRAYMDAQCSGSDAAAALNVHVNTVAYRLRRVQELLGIDLRSPATLLQIEFALMVERILASPQ